MVNAYNRELMTRLYRLVEKYEIPPKLKYTEDAVTYFEGIVDDCKQLYDAHPSNEFARRLAVGLYDALGDRFKAANPQPLIDKSAQVEIKGVL